MSQRLAYGIERQKASKMAQIENYVGILIENNKAYAEELNVLRKENTELRGQVEQLMGQLLRAKEGFEDSLAQTKATYAHEVGSLIDQLKDILSKKEQMEGSYKALLQQLSYQSEFDKAEHAANLGELQRGYESKLKILNDRIQEQSRELEANFYLNSDNKLKMGKEIDGLRFQVSQLRKINNDLAQGQAYLEGEVTRLSNALKAAGREREDMGVGQLKLQQEKNQAILQLRQSSSLLRQQLNDQLENLTRLEASLQAKQKQNLTLAERCHHQQRERLEYQDLYHKASLQLGQREAELSSLRMQLSRLNDSSAREAKKLADVIKVLEGENSQLLRERDDLQSQNLQKQQEIFTLIQRVQRLQRQHELATTQLAKTEEEAVALGKSNDMLKQQLQIALLQQKKANERCQLQNNHLDTLQRLLQKQKKRAALAEISSSDRQLLLARQAGVESEVAQRYEGELQVVLREKNEMVGMFQAEKDRLVRTYENALREKDLLFKDKIHYLQSEVLALSKFQ